MALTTGVNRKKKDGDLLALIVKNASTVYKGALACVGADGYLIAGADTAGLIFAGVAYESLAGNGVLRCRVERKGLYLFNIAAATIANIGDAVFIVDDNTVGLAATTTNDIYCGVIANFESATQVWVDIYPALLQTDVATHIADTSGAHAASSISITDAGTFTSETDVEGALQEIYQDLISAQKVIPIALGDFTLEDGTAITKYSAGGATPGFQQLANKEVVLTWDGNGTQTPIAVTVPFVDPGIDDAAAVVVHLLARMAGANDTPVIVHEAYFGAGDTDCAGTDPEVTGGVTLSEITCTIAHGDVPAAPSSLTIILTPTAGQMATDELYIYAAWLEVTSKLKVVVD